MHLTRCPCSLQSSKDTLKTRIPEERKRGVVYKSRARNVGESKRTLKVRLGEHKQAVKRGNPRNGIAVHAHETQHEIDWNATGGGCLARKALQVRLYI